MQNMSRLPAVEVDICSTRGCSICRDHSVGWPMKRRFDQKGHDALRRWQLKIATSIFPEHLEKIEIDQRKVKKN